MEATSWWSHSSEFWCHSICSAAPLLAAVCGRYESVVLEILASILQTRGPSHGVVFDPDELHLGVPTAELLLVRGEALREALRVFLELRKYGNPEDNTMESPCVDSDPSYHSQGRCLMTLFARPLAFKVWG